LYQGCTVTKTSHLPIRYFLALLWAHPILHVSGVRVNTHPCVAEHLRAGTQQVLSGSEPYNHTVMAHWWQEGSKSINLRTRRKIFVTLTVRPQALDRWVAPKTEPWRYYRTLYHSSSSQQYRTRHR